MIAIQLRLFGPLNDFVPRAERPLSAELALRERASVKDVIEAAGVPHPEVELVLVNGAAVDFSYLVRAGDRISVYPKFFAFDVRELSRVMPEPLPELRFVLDGHLGRLAAYLRALGFDTAYDTHANDAQLAELSGREARILLTRDIGLLKRGIVRHGYWMRATRPREQLAELDARWPLAELARPFSRCVYDNARLTAVDKLSVIDRLPPRTRIVYDEFFECGVCRRVYWRGSHHDHLLALFRAALNPPLQTDCRSTPAPRA